MNAADPHKQFDDQPRKANLIWAGAVLLVLIAWAGAFVIRGGEKAVIEGWQDGIEAGMAEAEASGKPMVVLFTADTCMPCQVLKRNVLSDEAVKSRLAEEYVPVQVDLTDMSERNPNVETAIRYGVESIPRVMAMTPAGELIGTYASNQRGGKESTALFMQWLDGLRGDPVAR